MNGLQLTRIGALLLIPLLSQTGCTTAKSSKRVHTGTETLPTPATPNGKPSFLRAMSHPWEILHFKPRSDPPRALELREIGVIRSISHDGTYVLVELDPGVAVTSGSDLVVLHGSGGESRLRVAEMRPPFFVADLLSGQPAPGDHVRQ